MAYSYWRVWGVEDGVVRVARDRLDALSPGPSIQPQHLEVVDGRVEWRPHEEGAEIPSINLWDFVSWLDQGGC